MSIKAKIVALTAVALVITGSVASTTTPAEAHGFNHYGFIGSEIAANDGYDYGGDHYCRWVPRFDMYGNYIGRVRNCGY